MLQKYDKEDTFKEKGYKNDIPASDGRKSTFGGTGSKDVEANMTSLPALTPVGNDSKRGVDNSDHYVSPESITTKI